MPGFENLEMTLPLWTCDRKKTRGAADTYPSHYNSIDSFPSHRSSSVTGSVFLPKYSNQLIYVTWGSGILAEYGRVGSFTFHTEHRRPLGEARVAQCPWERRTTTVKEVLVLTRKLHHAVVVVQPPR